VEYPTWQGSYVEEEEDPSGSGRVEHNSQSPIRCPRLDPLFKVNAEKSNEKQPNMNQAFVLDTLTQLLEELVRQYQEGRKY
jgi:hypothetical protein